MTTQSTPTVAKLALGALITRVRIASGKSPADVAAELGVDPSTYRRWESGKFSPRPISVKAIADAIRATPEEMSRMSTLAIAAKQRGLFEGRNVPPHLRAFYEAEASAVRIRSLELEHMPGLLQTPEYHIEVQKHQLPAEPGYSETLRVLRTQRQEIVFGYDDLPEMLFLIGMSAMGYLDRYSHLKDAQIARLREATTLGVDIRVITGFHAAMLGSFTIITPPESTGARPFVYVEDIDGGRYVEGDVVSQYEAVFGTVGDRQSVELEEYLR